MFIAAAARRRFSKSHQPTNRPRLLCIPGPVDENVARQVHRLIQSNMDFLGMVQSNKKFRNPSSYEQLIRMMDIDETGTLSRNSSMLTVEYTAVKPCAFQSDTWASFFTFPLSFLRQAPTFRPAATTQSSGRSMSTTSLCVSRLGPPSTFHSSLSEQLTR